MFGPISSIYKAKVKAKELQEDADQYDLVQALDKLYESTHKPLWQNILNKQAKGLYISGGVGRGKTYLMDMFFAEAKIKKQRLHFLIFKQLLFKKISLTAPNKWKKLAKSFLKNGYLLCLDEFQIEDVGDLRILEAFFKPFFQLGGILVTTSNYTPHNFQHTHGASKASFINFLEHYLNFISLSEGPDYRRRGTEKCQNFSVASYLSPISNFFKEPFKLQKNQCRYTFTQLCNSAVGPNEYEKIAQQCNQITITNVPQLSDNDADSLLRFMRLIDLVYEKDRKVLIYSKAPIEDLYIGKKYADIFKRTKSRLLDLTSR